MFLLQRFIKLDGYTDEWTDGHCCAGGTVKGQMTKGPFLYFVLRNL